MESKQILENALMIIRQAQMIRSQTKSINSTQLHAKDSNIDDFVIVPKPDEHANQDHLYNAPSISSFTDLLTEHADFAEKYPHLFKMCIDSPTPDHASNLINILPMMLRQRDFVMSDTSHMESATTQIVEKLNNIYIEHLNLPKKHPSHEQQAYTKRKRNNIKK